MTLTHKVMWKEGMFLRPHHFQQQDRRTETLLAARLAALQPWHWGFSALEIDEGRLQAGQVGVVACRGAFRDGTAFSLPGDAAALAPIAVGPEHAGKTVWLVTPSPGVGAPIGASANGAGPAATRYVIREADVPDLLREGAETATVEIGAVNLQLVAGSAPEGFDALPLARIDQVAQGRVTLDASFLPPMLSIAVAPALLRLVGEIAARYDARARHLAGPLGVAGGLSSGAIQQLLLLAHCNARAASLRLVEQAAGLHHPEPVYRELAMAAAELSTFTDRESRRAPPPPAYDHDDPARSFDPVIAVLMRGLGTLDTPEAEAIALDFHAEHNIHYNAAIEGRLLEGARLFLLARAAMRDEEFRRTLPPNASIASTGRIFEIMRAASRGVDLIAQASFPPEIRQMAGFVCFELDPNAPEWGEILRDRQIAIHVQADVALEALELWSVKT